MSAHLPDDTLLAPDGPAPAVRVPEDLAPARYAQLGLLGEGGMGKVHLCRDERIGREVAMKVILPDLEARAATRARFIREASVQGQLEHPSIVPVHDLGVTPEGETFFTMKRVRGLTLQEVLGALAKNDEATVERFTTRRLLGAFVNVCLAVDFAHSRGVVHRDLKPSNLMLGDFGEVYLLDWGIAKLADERRETDGLVREELPAGETPLPKTAAGAILGTLGYMAPEQALGEEASVRSDVFALGAVLFEILAGLPLRDPNATFVALVKGKIDARCSVRCPERRVAPELEAICIRATAREPEARFTSARALAEEVERFLEGDRDVIRRRELAAALVSAARSTLASAAPGSTNVMRDLGSALALDPENVEARAMVVEALTTVPRELPPEVKEAVERHARESTVHTARSLPIILASWFVLGPLVYFAGVKEPRMIALALGLMTVGTGAGLLRARWEKSPSWLEVVSFAASAMAMVVVGRGVGPFVLAPTLLATFGTALQLHPKRRSRVLALVITVGALVGAVVFELSDLLPRTSGISPSALLIGPSTGDRHLALTAVLLLMNVTAMVTTALTVASVRAQLTRAEERLLVHSWQVRGMMPTSVAARSSERGIPAAAPIG